jgi:hypothetical protein
MINHVVQEVRAVLVVWAMITGPVALGVMGRVLTLVNIIIPKAPQCIISMAGHLR